MQVDQSNSVVALPAQMASQRGASLVCQVSIFSNLTRRPVPENLTKLFSRRRPGRVTGLQAPRSDQEEAGRIRRLAARSRIFPVIAGNGDPEKPR